VPLELRPDRWTVVCIDVVETMQKSQIFPSTFSVEGAHSLKSILLCANIQVRGVYTSDNLYDYVTMPSDMRFKFAFDLSKWEEYFDFLQLPY
jgi:WD repeat-containing protein 90